MNRVFIAINLPEDIKKKLKSYKFQWPELPCHWTKRENLHITLAFLGYVSDEEFLKIIQIVKEIALKHNSFLIKLNKICYGPSQGQTLKKPIRMVWAEGEKSEELGKLQKDLENSLFSTNLPADSSAEILSETKTGIQTRKYSPHITLARIKQLEFRRIEPESRPEINEEINLNFEVNSIEVMESRLKRDGAEYIVLESISLADSENSNF